MLHISIYYYTMPVLKQIKYIFRKQNGKSQVEFVDLEYACLIYIITNERVSSPVLQVYMLVDIQMPCKYILFNLFDGFSSNIPMYYKCIHVYIISNFKQKPF